MDATTTIITTVLASIGTVVAEVVLMSRSFAGACGTRRATCGTKTNEDAAYIKGFLKDRVVLRFQGDRAEQG